jgi:hypothetical protein
MVFALDGVGKMVLDSNGRIGVGPTPTNVATYNNSGKNFSVAGESSTYPSTITQVGDGSTTYGNGYYAKEVFRITGLGSATEISRITGTGSNGFGLYIKVIACGHSASTGSAVNIKEYFYTGGTAAATQISSVTSGTVPPITIDTSTNNVVIVKLASANPAAGSFNGTVIIEWAVSPSFDSAPGGLWTIS